MVLLTRLAKQVYRLSGEEMLGMHLRELMTLSYVRDHDGCPQHALADVLCMDANNVVLVLNELEAHGHIARRRDTEDRRRHRVELTAQGRRALTRAERAQEGIEDEILQALDPAERATLWQLLTRALYGAEPVQEGGPRDKTAQHDGVKEVAVRGEPARDETYSATTASIST